MFRAIGPLLLVVSLQVAVFADVTVKLKSAQVFTGSVVSEDDNFLVLDIDGSKVRISKSMIEVRDGATVDMRRASDTTSIPAVTAGAPETTPSLIRAGETGDTSTRANESLPLRQLSTEGKAATDSMDEGPRAEHPLSTDGDAPSGSEDQDPVTWFKEIPRFLAPRGLARVVVVRQRFAAQIDKASVTLFCGTHLVASVPEGAVVSFVVRPGAYRFIALHDNEEDAADVVDATVEPNTVLYLRYRQVQRGLFTHRSLMALPKDSLESMLKCSLQSPSIPLLYVESNLTALKEDVTDLDEDRYVEAVEGTFSLKEMSFGAANSLHADDKVGVLSSGLNRTPLTPIPAPPLSTGRKEFRHGLVAFSCGLVVGGCFLVYPRLFTVDGGAVLAIEGGLDFIIGVVKTAQGCSRRARFRQWNAQYNRCSDKNQ